MYYVVGMRQDPSREGNGERPRSAAGKVPKSAEKETARVAAETKDILNIAKEFKEMVTQMAFEKYDFHQWFRCAKEKKNSKHGCRYSLNDSHHFRAAEAFLSGLLQASNASLHASSSDVRVEASTCIYYGVWRILRKEVTCPPCVDISPSSSVKHGGSPHSVHHLPSNFCCIMLRIYRVQHGRAGDDTVWRNGRKYCSSYRRGPRGRHGRADWRKWWGRKCRED